MKKILFMASLLISSLITYAQKADTTKATIQKEAEAIGHGGNNELKINLLFTVLGMPEISYERLVTDNMGVGISVFAGSGDIADYGFGFIPHYRIYFGAKKASGFFIEGNTGIISVASTEIYYSSSSYYPNGYTSTKSNTVQFGLGAAAGAKFLTRNGFLGEAYLGVGRFLGDRSNYSGEAYPRVGITIGKRFK